MPPILRRFALAPLLAVALASCSVAPPSSVDAWGRQFGTSSRDTVSGVAVDAAGTTFVAGATLGALEGANQGGNDAYVRSYDASGSLRWTGQFGTDSDDYASDVAVDDAGNVYVTGSTYGGLEGSNAGGLDAYVRSFDGGGTHRWTTQFSLIGDDQALGVTTDIDGNVYVTGYIPGFGDNAGNADVFVVSYDPSGSLRWQDFFGTPDADVGGDIAVDAAGNTYVTGRTEGGLDGANAGGDDAFVRAYDPAGSLRWMRQFGTAGDDGAYGLAVDADANVYITGFTVGELVPGGDAGLGDGYLRSYDSAGTLRWTRQFGTPSTDVPISVAVDAGGNLHVSGRTQGALGDESAGGTDAFVRSYGANGDHLTTLQFGTSGSEEASAIAFDGDGRAYVGGHTSGALDGAHAGNYDGFVRSFDP